MNVRGCLALWLGAIAWSAWAMQPQAATSLRAGGAVGDGVTDDRAAIEAALMRAAGARVDGEGRSYAVRGNIKVEVDVDFHNATLIQTMDAADTLPYLAADTAGTSISVKPAQALLGSVRGVPKLSPAGVASNPAIPPLSEAQLAKLRAGIVIRTLSIEGETSRPVRVKLGGIKMIRGRNAAAGGSSDASALRIRHASPVQLEELEISGPGKGIGVVLLECAGVRAQGLYLHDFTWAPYAGDGVLDTLTSASLRDDFAWNNFPLYEFRETARGFVRQRAREQVVGLYVGRSRDVEISKAKIERLQARVGRQLLPLQSDGITLNRVQGLALRDCDIADTWEGIDFTGAEGSDFRYEQCTVTRAMGTAFKFVYVKRNGVLRGCTANAAGQIGFSIGRQSEAFELEDCRALETGGTAAYTRPDGSRVATICGFDIAGAVGMSTPRKITLKRCAAVNVEHAGAMDYGIRCETPPGDRQIRLIDCRAEGARRSGIEGWSD